MSSKSKGSRYERKLVGALRSQGFFARRAGSSGSGGTDESYDVIAAKDGKVYVIELKFVSSGRTRFDSDKIHGTQGNGSDDHDGLVGIAKQFGATPLLVSRFSGDTTFYAFTPSQAGPPTDAGAYTVGHGDCKDDAMVLASA